jgi:hypothetical protein
MQPHAQARAAPSLDRERKPLNMTTRTIERIVQERVLTIGRISSPSQPSPIRVRLDQIDIEKKTCLLQVEDTKTGHKSSGWVLEGQCASFAPDEVGTGGLEITKITPEEVTVQFNSCRYVKLIDGKPADEQASESIRSPGPPSPRPATSAPATASDVSDGQ